MLRLRVRRRRFLGCKLRGDSCMPERRNIVLITLDSVRADHCSFMGYYRETTPNIDRMAREGLCFENAIASEVGTPSSMITIFTGEYSGINPTADPRPWREVIKNRKTLAQVLSEKGYATGAFNPNAYASSYYGFNKGFSYFEDFLYSNEQSSRGTLRRLYAKIFDIVEREKKGTFSTLRNFMMFLGKEEIFRSWESYYDLILKWISKAINPFFLWVLIIDTHHPYLAPRRFRKYSNFFEMWYSNYKLQKSKWKNKLSLREREWLVNAYDDSIRYADSFIRRLWNDLKNLDPIFIIHADHGEGFGEHGLYAHHVHFLYEEFIHVPLVIYNADVKGRIDKPISLLGLAPTILELIGEENEFPSKSFLNQCEDWVVSEVFEGEKRRVAVRMKDWKFITGQKDEDELYNLKKDPHEQENVINEHPELAKEMKKIAEIHVKQEMKKRRIRERISRLNVRAAANG